MALCTTSIIRTVVALVFAGVVDLALFYAGGVVVQSGHFQGNLARIWAVAVCRYLTQLGIFRLALAPLKPVLVRCVVAQSLLPSVYETGCELIYGRNVESVCQLFGDVRSWCICTAATAVGALFWEISLPDADDAANGKENKQRARVLFARVVRLYKPDILLLLGAFVFLSLAVGCEMFIPFYTGRVIDILGSEYDWNEFLAAIVFMCLYSVGSSFSAGCRGGLFMCAINSFTCRVNTKLFRALVSQEIGFFEATKTGEFTSRLSRDTNLMSRTVALNVNVLLRTLIKTLGVISLMVGLSWKLTFLVLMETPITSLIQGVYDTHYRRLTREVQDSMAHVNEAANEVVSGIRVVRSFNMERFEARRYDDRLMVTHSLKTRRDTVRAVYLLARRVTSLGMQVVMLYYGRLSIQRGLMTTGNLVSFILYQNNLGDNIRTLIYIFGDMLNSVGAAGKVFEYMDREPLVNNQGSLAPKHLTGHVTFQSLAFSYPSHPDKTVLQDLSLELKPGQMTALVGPSGEGKSTCVSLLERFYEPQCGEILLDGHPLRAYQHSYLHKKIALVSQEPVLFSSSIKDNIAYGLPGCSLDEIQEAARTANAHDFILQLEKGYDTEVGEGGGQLSKSERQRIAIARALVRRPQVLIMDEITSSLDPDSEAKVQQGLARYPQQTRLIVAHRLKTVEKAHQIAMIGQGRVLERGTHQELMAMKGSYYRLKEKLFTQLGSEEQLLHAEGEALHTVRQ